MVYELPRVTLRVGHLKDTVRARRPVWSQWSLRSMLPNCVRAFNCVFLFLFYPHMQRTAVRVTATRWTNCCKYELFAPTLLNRLELNPGMLKVLVERQEFWSSLSLLQVLLTQITRHLVFTDHFLCRWLLDKQSAANKTGRRGETWRRDSIVNAPGDLHRLDPCSLSSHSILFWPYVYIKHRYLKLNFKLAFGSHQGSNQVRTGPETLLFPSLNLLLLLQTLSCEVLVWSYCCNLSGNKAGVLRESQTICRLQWMSEDAFRASRLTVLLRMMEEPRPLLIYFSALGIHPNFDLYVGESWQQRYSVIFHFTLLTALVTVSRCNATVVLYYTGDGTRQTVLSLLFFNFSFATLALQQERQKTRTSIDDEGWGGLSKGLFKAGPRFCTR